MTMTAPPIVKTGLADQIYSVVRERIVSGDLSGEAAIRQDALAAELGVSKIPLREAFARLEQDGLVIAKANRGFFVSPLSTEEAYDVFDLRLKLEPAAVAEGARYAVEADHEEAKSALVALNEATIERAAVVASLNRAFHMALVRPSGRIMTLQIIERLQVVAERYVVKHLEPTGRSARAIAEHETLYAAWSAGDADEAARLSAAHIEATSRDLRTELEKERLSSRLRGEKLAAAARRTAGRPSQDRSARDN
jgi:DNA-binding GntR family transcriptional regulator